MSIFNSIKRAMGFGAYDEEIVADVIADDSDASVMPLLDVHHHDQPAQQPSHTVEPSVMPVPQDGNKQLLAIFAGVLAIFNEAQPQFIRDCLDRDAQRRYLFDALDNSLKEYLLHLGDDARREADEATREEREKMMNDMA
ncbi:MAG: hypothetical protein K2M76_01305, partial [Muribaculaceae bacterium]|nr:hypothetical protein [Muribaculaceae bacterium]